MFRTHDQTMDDTRSDTFRRLEEAIAQWRDQASRAQAELAERLEQTRQRLEAAPAVTAAEATARSVEALRSAVAEWTEATRQNTERLGELKAEFEALRAEDAAASGSSVEELRSDLSALRQDLRVLDTLSDRLDELQRQVHERPWGEEDEGRGAATPPPESWQEVARLRAQLEDELDADPEGRFVGAGQIEALAYDRAGNRRRMGEILIEAGIITPEQLRSALAEQERAPHRRLGSILIEKGYTGETIIARVLASQLRTRYVDLRHEELDVRTAGLISPRMARHHQCIPIAATPDRLILAMANPFDLIAVDDVELTSRRQVETVVATATDIRDAVDRLFGPRPEETLQPEEDPQTEEEPQAEETPQPEEPAE